jgi:hypothetical protein
MSNSKISALTGATTPLSGTEVLPIVQSGATVKVSVGNLTDGLNTIPVAKGGTGLSSLTSGGILYASSTSALSTSSSFTYNGNFTVGTTASTGYRCTSYGVSYGILSSISDGNGTAIKIENTDTSGSGINLQINSYNTAGTGWYHQYATSGNNSVLNYVIYGNGNIQNANNSYGSLSDAKLKTDVSLSNSQWSDVKALAAIVCKFKLKNDAEQKQQIGWIAQEVRNISPGLVFEKQDFDSDMNPTNATTLGINYSVAHMKAFKALGEAMERIEMLEQKLSRLVPAI